MGKFYEMFEMDAHVGHDILGLEYMKGEQPHCGFPEKNYENQAAKLVAAGLRVVAIEQTETPEMLAERNRHAKVKEKVVRREVVQVLTCGTVVDPDMLHFRQQRTSWLLCLCEMASE